MKRWCFLVSALVFVSLSNAQVSVHGELSGLFLDSKGQLVWKTVTESDRTCDLQPLWGHYRLVLTVRSPGEPIKSVEVLNERGQKVWQQRVEPPKNEIRLPAYPPSALQVHASEGFKFSLSITFVSGIRVRRNWQVPLTKPAHPFRIDWFSVAAATEAMRLMRTYGGSLFPRFSKMPIAWCFKGENGQLFVNHPNPPKGSRKVNLAFLPCVPTFWLPEKRRPYLKPGAIGGETGLIGGKFTACIHYSPVWATRDPTSLSTDIFNATIWVYIALHEALHAISLSAFKVKEEQTAAENILAVSKEKLVDWLVTQWVEKEALKRAIETANNAEEIDRTKEMREDVEKGLAKITPPPVAWSKPKEEWIRLSQRWAWAFLQFRERRRALYGKDLRWRSRSEQIVEWTENISHWGAVHLLEMAEGEEERVSSLLRVDPTAVSYPNSEIKDWAESFAETDTDRLSLEPVSLLEVGKLLSYYDEDWLVKATKGANLERLLAEAVSYSTASPEERSKTIDEIVQEVIASAAQLRRELQHFLSPSEGKPCLVVKGKSPKWLRLEWSDEDEALTVGQEDEDNLKGKLKAIVLEWHDGSSLRVSKGCNLVFRRHDEVEVFSPLTQHFWVTCQNERFLVQIGKHIQFQWMAGSGELSVTVFGERWRYRDGKASPNWLPPEGWMAIKFGQHYLWLKAVVRGGLQKFYEGGKRWGEAAMLPILKVQIGTFIAEVTVGHALTLEAPQELLFIAKAVDGFPLLRSLSVSLGPLGDENRLVFQTTSPKGAEELRLFIPFELRWQVESEDDKQKKIVWLARFKNEEIRWFPDSAFVEVRVETTKNETCEVTFINGTLQPMLLAMEINALEELPSQGLKFNYGPAIGSRCRLYLYRDEFSPERAELLAEGTTDETGKLVLLVPFFDLYGAGLKVSALVEHEGMKCRRLEGINGWLHKHNLFYGLISSIPFKLAHHEVTFTLEIEGVREFYRLERKGEEWRYVKERTEPVNRVRVVVTRREAFSDRPPQVIFDGEVEGRLTLTIPTLGHGLKIEPQDYNRYDLLQVQIIDPVTGSISIEHLTVDIHRLGPHRFKSDEEMWLTGKNNPPIKLKVLFRAEVVSEGAKLEK